MRMRLNRRRGGDDGGDAVNLSPLIDMTFLLLIFFVVSSTLIDDAEIEIERPSAASGEKVEARALRVAINREGQIFVSGEEVPSWMVETRVRHELEGHATGRVLAVVDATVDAKLLVDVVDQCRLAGAKGVGVAVDEAF